MPSTYTLNNGIELIATGEQSGTWGDTTNTNLALIDTALDGQVTITLAAAGSSGSPNTLPISDGSASNGRNRLVIFADGGDLGATAFVQLTPNDAEKIVYIRNDLSGGRAITLFQGTYNASNDYEVPAGTTAVVFFNGGGAGAVAANVFNNAFFDSLRLGGVSVTAILDEDNMASDSATALATQQSIKAYVDAQVTAQDLDFAGDSGTGAVDLDSQTFTIAGTANEIETAASGQTITVGLPNAVTIASLTATTADINGGTIDGTVIGGSTPAAISGTTGTFSGNLTVDTDTLFVDAANNRVGIGTSDPSSGTSTYYDDLVIKNDTSGSGAGITIQSNTTNGFGAVEFRKANGTQVGKIYASSADGQLGFETGGSEKMRITSSGNVGIGTSSFAYAAAGRGLIGLNGSSSSLIEFQSGGTARGYIISDTSGLKAASAGATSLQFETNSSERMRIDSNGRVQINTTIAKYTSLLTLAKGSNAYNITSSVTGTNSQGHIVFENNDADAVGSIFTNGSATSYNTSSDYRLKEDVQPMVGSVDRLMALKPVNFAWKVDGSRVDGFLAHEAQEVVPEAVTGSKDAVDKDGKPEYQGIDQSKLVPLLTAALQEALQKIEALEARVAALEA